MCEKERIYQVRNRVENRLKIGVFCSICNINPSKNRFKRNWIVDTPIENPLSKNETQLENYSISTTTKKLERV